MSDAAGSILYVAPPDLLPAARPPPGIKTRPTAARALGRTLLAFWALIGLALAAYLVAAWDPAKLARYGPELLQGLVVTLKLVGISVVIGAVLGFGLALMRLSANPLLAWPAYVYVYVMRGTPLLAQAFLVYYGAGSFREELQAAGLWTFFRDAENCALFVFTLNTAAYQAEILKGAIAAVPRGQREAAATLGLSASVAFLKVVLPQALITALRPLGNEVILMIKGSAIVALITVLDLMGETRLAFSRTFDFQVYLWAAIIYLAVVEALRRLIALVEERLTRHLRRT